MTAALRALIGKELQQHKGTLFWLVCFSSLVTWMLFRIATVGGQVLSYLAITSTFAVPILVVIAFVLGQRLVAAEYYGQTQLAVRSRRAQRAASWR